MYEYNNVISMVRDKAIKSVNVDDNDKLLKKCEILSQITLYLRDRTFKDKVVKECMGILYDSDFFAKLDSCVNLTGFDNGYVYDCFSNKFRPTEYDDLEFF